MSDYYQEVKEYMVTAALILANVIVFVASEALGGSSDSEQMIRLGALYPSLIQEGGQYYRFLTSLFLHFGIYHLMNNMVLLGASGTVLEKALGHVKFGILYLGAGLAGSMVSYWHMLSAGDYAVSAGASGAIFGVLGGLLWVVIVHRGNYERLSRKGMIFMIILALYCGFTEPNVDNAAHIGGLTAGFLLAILLYRRPKRH